MSVISFQEAYGVILQGIGASPRQCPASARCTRARLLCLGGGGCAGALVGWGGQLYRRGS